MILGVVTAFCWIITTYTQLQGCVSDSLEGVRYLLVLKGGSFQRGDIVSIQGHSIKYAGTKLLTKRLIGLPGDQIFKNGGKLSVTPSKVDDNALNNNCFNFEKHDAAIIACNLQRYVDLLNLATITLPLLHHTKEGRPLTPLVLNEFGMTIPKGYVFVAGDHPQSFDSRYEEFGLVPVEKIWGKAVLTW